MSRFTTADYMAWKARQSPSTRQPAALPDAAKREITGLHHPIIEECKRRGWKYVHSDPTRRTTCGDGVCDFIIYADRGRMFHVECKALNGKLSMEQRIFIVWVEHLGHKVHVITAMSEFMEAVR
jgi:hypothetical protein